MQINSNFEKLVPNYLFADVAKKTNEFSKAHPDREIIRLGIGDVTLPLSSAVVDAMKKGERLIIEGTSSKGTLTKDTYSLKGFSAAYRAISSKCRR